MIKTVAAAALGLALVSVAGEAAAQSLSGPCQFVYRQYRAANGPKAFAVSNYGTCGWWHGARTMADSQRNALNACRGEGRPGCRIVESSF